MSLGLKTLSPRCTIPRNPDLPLFKLEFQVFWIVSGPPLACLASPGSDVRSSMCLCHFLVMWVYCGQCPKSLRNDMLTSLMESCFSLSIDFSWDSARSLVWRPAGSWTKSHTMVFQSVPIPNVSIQFELFFVLSVVQKGRHVLVRWAGILQKQWYLFSNTFKLGTFS